MSSMLNENFLDDYLNNDNDMSLLDDSELREFNEAAEKAEFAGLAAIIPPYMEEIKEAKQEEEEHPDRSSQVKINDKNSGKASPPEDE